MLTIETEIVPDPTPQMIASSAGITLTPDGYALVRADWQRDTDYHVVREMPGYDLVSHHWSGKFEVIRFTSVLQNAPSPNDALKWPRPTDRRGGWAAYHYRPGVDKKIHTVVLYEGQVVDLKQISNLDTCDAVYVYELGLMFAGKMAGMPGFYLSVHNGNSWPWVGMFRTGGYDDELVSLAHGEATIVVVRSPSGSYSTMVRMAHWLTFGHLTYLPTSIAAFPCFHTGSKSPDWFCLVGDDLQIRYWNSAEYKQVITPEIPPLNYHDQPFIVHDVNGQACLVVMRSNDPTYLRFITLPHP